MSFAPDKSAEDKGRINAVEDYLSLLTERIKFCFNGIDENIAQKSDGKEEKQLIYSTIAGEVGQLTTTGIDCEIFNDYENNIASSLYAHAEGSGTKATAPSTHAEGSGTAASNTYAHAEGNSTTASGISSHAEGENTTASGYCSHAEGYNATASGGYSHAEGYNAVASGFYSHAGGINSEAKAEASFAHGEHAVSNYRGGAAFGIMNKTKDALFVVGNGSPRGSYESDALVLDDGGNLWVAGSIKCSGGSGGYTLSPATADTLGGVMIGENINVSDSGTISVDLSAYLKSDEISDWAKLSEKPTYTANEIGLGDVNNTADIDKPISTATQTALDGKADTGHTHTVSDITDMPAYLTQETDPTVPAWAKSKNKPTYTADEVGAAKKKHTHNVSDITDMPEWTKTENKPVYTASEVGAATAADITAAVNAVEIGGRNLLYDSTGNLKKGWSGNTIITVDGGISGNSLAISRTGYSGNARYFGTSKRHFLTDFEVGTSYTLSAWIKVRSDVELDASGYVMARFRSADNAKLHILPLTVNNKTKKDEWLYCEKTWTIDDSDIAKLECVALALDKNGMIEACNIKLEKGTKATDWSPAPEEDTERIASLEARVAALCWRVTELLAQVLELHADLRPDLFIHGTVKYTENQLSDIFADEKTPVFVAVDDSDTVQGYAFCILKEPAFATNMTDIKTLYIDDLCVDSNARGRHIGTTLFDYVMDFAKQTGCYTVTLNVWEGNDSARHFYEKMGMFVRETQMERRVAGRH